MPQHYLTQFFFIETSSLRLFSRHDSLPLATCIFVRWIFWHMHTSLTEINDVIRSRLQTKKNTWINQPMATMAISSLRAIRALTSSVINRSTQATAYSVCYYVVLLHAAIVVFIMSNWCSTHRLHLRMFICLLMRSMMVDTIYLIDLIEWKRFKKYLVWVISSNIYIL